MIRCTVPMTRAIRLRSCMIGNGHVQFCSGRRRGNPPPDRNQMRLEGHCGLLVGEGLRSGVISTLLYYRSPWTLANFGEGIDTYIEHMWCTTLPPRV